MNWEELEKKHAKEWQFFNELKILEWQKLQKRNNEIMEAFGNEKDEMPTSQLVREENELNDWNKQWGEEGEKSAALKELQIAEKKELSDKVRKDFKMNLSKVKSRDFDRER